MRKQNKRDDSTREISELAENKRVELEKQNEYLERDLIMINDAIVSYMVDARLPISTVINDLGNQREVDKIIAKVEPESMFHNNPRQVQNLRSRLTYYKDRKYFSYQHSLYNLSNILNNRREENLRFLSSW